MSSPSLNRLPLEVIGIILGQLESAADLSSAIRSSRSAWDAFWCQRKAILRSVVQQAMDLDSLKTALAIIHFPKLDSHIQGVEKRLAIMHHMDSHFKGRIQLQRSAGLSEIIKLHGLNHTIEALMADYFSKAHNSAYFHIPAWSDSSFRRCPAIQALKRHSQPLNSLIADEDRRILRKAFLDYVLAAEAFQLRPGESSLFSADEQARIFLSRLTSQERTGLKMLYAYVYRTYGAIFEELVRDFFRTMEHTLWGDMQRSGLVSTQSDLGESHSGLRPVDVVEFTPLAPLEVAGPMESSMFDMMYDSAASYLLPYPFQEGFIQALCSFGPLTLVAALVGGKDRFHGYVKEHLGFVKHHGDSFLGMDVHYMDSDHPSWIKDSDWCFWGKSTSGGLLQAMAGGGCFPCACGEESGFEGVSRVRAFHMQVPVGLFQSTVAGFH
jgi:hypothetical protein